MSIFKAYKIWEKKKENSDFRNIKISSSGSFQMKSGDLFRDRDEVKKYAKILGNSIKTRTSLTGE